MTNNALNEAILNKEKAEKAALMVERVFRAAIHAIVPQHLWRNIDTYMFDHADGKLPPETQEIILLKKRLEYFSTKYPHPYEDEL